MFYHRVFRSILLLGLCFCVLQSIGQSRVNSPYSRFGIGEVNDRNFFASQNMGGLGASFIDPYGINIVNPATLASLQATSFDIGIFAENSGFRDLGETDYTRLWGGNINNLSLAIPLQNKLNDLLDRKKRDLSFATAFTLQPFSVVGYNITTEDTSNEDIGRVIRNFSGNGGTFQFTWSNAVKYKHLSFGANLTYLFGKLNFNNQLLFADNLPAFTTATEASVGVTGFQYNLGVIYDHHFNEKAFKDQEAQHLKRVSIGLYGNTTTNFTSEEQQLNIVRQFELVTADIISTDTIGSSAIQRFSGVLPSELGFGVTYYYGEKFAIGADFVRNGWSQFNANFVNNPLNSTYRLSIGGFYRPNYKSITKYFSRVLYRFGVHYEMVPTEDLPANNGKRVTDMGVNLGFGLPFFYQRKISHANLGISAGFLGRGTAIEERYIRATFSFTFNDDEWFIKRKYN